jgi:hypothetical protein
VLHLMTLAPGEFIRRFLLHVLPKGFHRIRPRGAYLLYFPICYINITRVGPRLCPYQFPVRRVVEEWLMTERRAASLIGRTSCLLPLRMSAVCANSESIYSIRVLPSLTHRRHSEPRKKHWHLVAIGRFS